MSYILEALRRAQAERERGQVPGLESHHVSASAPAPAATRRLPLGLGLAALALVVASVAYFVLSPQTLQEQAKPEAQPLPSNALSSAAPRAAPAPPPTAPAPLPARLPMVVSALPTPNPPPASPSEAAQAPIAMPAPGTVPAPVAAPTHTVPAESAAASAPVVALATLSAEQRRDFPPMVFGGSVWSPIAAARLVVINGRVVQEGETAVRGVRLERIGPKSVILQWRAMRLEVPI
jgi:general secretion pathway protein B